MRKQYHFRPSARGLLVWDVDRLITLTKESPRLHVLLTAIRELDEPFWFARGAIPTCRSVVDHARLMHAADLSFPIILSSDGRVMDGMHRVAKAALLGRETIDAVQFGIDPDPDYVGVHPDELPYEESTPVNEPAPPTSLSESDFRAHGLAAQRIHTLLQSVTELPFNRFVGIQTASEPAQLLRIPAGAQYLNHLGTVHASAQLALAEACSGEFLLRHFGSSGGVVPVVRRLEAKFRKPATGAVTSTVSMSPTVLEQLAADLAAKGRAIVSVAVELHDESGAHTLSATVEWFITKVPDQTGNAGADTSAKHTP